MNKAALISAFELLDDFLTEGKAAPVWRVVGGGSALLVQRLIQELGHADLIPGFS